MEGFALHFLFILKIIHKILAYIKNNSNIAGGNTHAMNIFALDKSPKKSAEMLVNSHIVKMPLESCQMLCTTHHFFDKKTKAPYKKSFVNHPCTIWVRESLSNYLWLTEHAYHLCLQYTNRYKKRHKCMEVVEWCINNYPKGLKDIGLTDFAIAMPVEYVVEGNPIQSYREYYRIGKKHLHIYTNSEMPEFLVEKETDPIATINIQSKRTTKQIRFYNQSDYDKFLSANNLK